MTNIELKMKELADKAVAAREASILNRLEDPAYQQRFINYKINEGVFKFLSDMEITFRSIVEMNPVQRADNTPKKWTNRYVYGIGDSVRILVNLLNGFRYAAAPHRALMKVELPISESIAGQAVDAIGTFSYFNSKTNEVVQGDVGDATKATELLEIIATELGLVIDFSQLTQANLEKIEAKALADANRSQAAFLAAIEHSQSLGIDFSM
ncbi:MAG: hypothetical protein JHC33_11790 [Ignisphaera sp.]|nr:hypothetical protein [Ignisphaera sp.]